MPVNIITDTDFAGVPYDAKPEYVFKLTKETNRPFAGMLPLSHVLDPAREEECVAQLAEQFRRVPLGDMKLLHIQDQLGHHMFHGLQLTDSVSVKQERIRPFCDCFGAAESKALMAAMEHTEQETQRGVLSQALTDAFKSIKTPEQVDLVLERMRQAAETHNLPPHTKSLQDTFSRVFHGSSPEFQREHLESAGAMMAAPEEMARKHYDALKAAARSHEMPAATVAGHMPAVEKILAGCPPYIRDCANQSHMKVVIANEAKVTDICPFSGGVSFFGETQGMSTGQGIYVNAPMLENPVVLSEEIIHEVEGRVINGGKLSDRFCARPEWKSAIIRDTAQAADNPVFKRVTRNPIKLGGDGHKFNNAIGSCMEPITQASKFEKFVESVPDLYHYHAAATEELARKGHIIIAGKKFTTADQMMQAAFPNAWPMLEGPGEVMKLAQHADGRIVSLAHDAVAPEGATLVRSLREHCEARSGIKSAPRMVSEPQEYKFLRELGNEKWVGKKGLAVVGATVAIGAAYYAYRQWTKPKKQDALDIGWTDKVTQEQPQRETQQRTHYPRQ